MSVCVCHYVYSLIVLMVFYHYQVEIPYLEEEDYESDDDDDDNTPSNNGEIFHCETVCYHLHL